MLARRGVDSQTGMSLIEVLVSLLIFSSGVLGMVALQANAIKFSGDAENRNRAALLANELVSTMWAHKSVDLDAATLTDWQDRVARPAESGLPSGLGALNADGTGLVTIRIEWRAQTGNAAHAQTSVYTTRFVMP